MKISSCRVNNLRYDHAVNFTTAPVATKHMQIDRERTLWLALGAGAAIGAGMLARRGAAVAWRHTRQEHPPLTVEDEDMSWPAVLAWAAFSGFCVAFARVVGRGVAREGWRQMLGRNPPTR